MSNRVIDAFAVRLKISLLASIFLGCASPADAPPTMRPQSVVLLVTPKIIPDFAKPDSAIAALFEHYKPLISKASETIIIFAVGNSDHILNYRGSAFWKDSIEWARTTNYIPVSNRRLDYQQVDQITKAFRRVATAAGMKLKVFEHIDSGNEFTVSNTFKYVIHPECTSNRWGSFDIRGRLQADNRTYASAPSGIVEGKLCGEFLADQVGRYILDLGFDGIMYDNQLGTRGRWLPDDGPGFSTAEASAISKFLKYSRRALGAKELMWFDSYNPVAIEKDTYSFPADGYGSFNYLIASGFCVIPTSAKYADNLMSKIGIPNSPKILATLDYLDPWYDYHSITDFPLCVDKLEKTAIEQRFRVDGMMFFAHDEVGNFVPRARIEAFAASFFANP